MNFLKKVNLQDLVKAVNLIEDKKIKIFNFSLTIKVKKAFNYLIILKNLINNGKTLKNNLKILKLQIEYIMIRKTTNMITKVKTVKSPIILKNLTIFQIQKISLKIFKKKHMNKKANILKKILKDKKQIMIQALKHQVN